MRPLAPIIFVATLHAPATSVAWEPRTPITARPLALVQETERLLVINKPEGLAFASDGGDDGVVKVLRTMLEAETVGV